MDISGNANFSYVCDTNMSGHKEEARWDRWFFMEKEEEVTEKVKTLAGREICIDNVSKVQ